MLTRNWKKREIKNMVILVDTNITVDAVAERHPFAEYANKIIEKCARREIIGILAAHSISNLFYILRKDFNPNERRYFLKDLCAVFYISNLDEKKILAALDRYEFIDFEDCLQEESVVEAMADYIITRNSKDFVKSRVKVIQPDEFLKLLG